MNIDFPLKLGVIKDANDNVFNPNTPWFLNELNHFNCFIGPNNSGKSRLIRFLCNLKHTDIFLDNKSETSQRIKDALDRLYPNNYMERRASNVTNIMQIKLFKELKKERNIINTKDLFQTFKEVCPDQINGSTEHHYNSLSQVVNQDLAQLSRFKFDTELQDLNKINWKKTYIPVLRSLRPLGIEKTEDFFKTRTIDDYFPQLNQQQNKPKINIFTGHSIYNDIQRALLGSHEERTKVAHFESFLSQKFFNHLPVTLIPKLNDDVISIRIGDEERDICSVGDGIQSIIIITFPAFMENQNTMFFVEEPEKFLHAGMQRVLVDTLSEFKQHIFFFTTHSNHFLDLASERNDLSIYKVQRQEKKTALENQKNFKHILDELGIRASSVLLANSSIWVEGVTDHKYLRVYLRKYIESLGGNAKSFIEDLHYTFFEYQGSNIGHWDFASEHEDRDTNNKTQRLRAGLTNNNIFLIADGDIKSKEDRVRELETSLGDCFYKIKEKEIENLIPLKYLKRYAQYYWNNRMQDTDGLELDLEGLEERDLLDESNSVGVILEQCIKGTKPTPDKTYFQKGITIHRKSDFCDDIIKLILEDWDNFELTPELNELCESIYKHIQSANS
ncbi:AAA family ATPase [Pseudoalteromonas phenolica]|uniref:AAA family ATPase n=1 Tax=Pseudoalteromonas phenolica TaxID=161398 RepID=UPI00384B7C69